MRNKFLIIYVCILFSVCVFAQNEKPLVRKGNSDYKKEKYSDAEINYRKSLEKNKNSAEGSFNLGDALYKQKKYDEAAGAFHNLSNTKAPDDIKANTYYNLGNSYLQNDKYEESINAYKQALRLNSKDEDARYNLSYALQKLKQQQQQQKQDKKDEKKKQEEKKEQQQDKKEEQKKEQDQKQQQQQQQKISKEDAERMLEALKNDEKNLQKKLAKKEGARVSIEKQW